jgi:DNA helicase HerA-like ATPase
MMTDPNNESLRLGKVDSTKQPLLWNSNMLLKHAMVLGSSGSGKTYLSKVIVEEAIRNGIPVIAIDSQGDIASLAVQKMGPQDTDISSEYWSRLDFKIWTPGSEWGIPISLKPEINISVLDGKKYEDAVRYTFNMASEVAALAGMDDEATIAGVAKCIEYAHVEGLLIESLDGLIALIEDPPAKLYKQLEFLFDSKSRSKLLKTILIKANGPRKLMMELGKPLDIDKLFGYDEDKTDNNKVRVSVISLTALHSLEDKQLFLATLSRALYDWMLADPRTYPMGLLYIDEAAPYLPPVRKPVCKEPIMMLLRQARKYGLSILIATQSPGDLDFVGTAQIGTKFIGRITTQQEADKLRPLLEGNEDLIDQLPDLKQGQFYGVCADTWGPNPVPFKARTLVSDHKTMTLESCDEFVTYEDRARYG